MNGIATRTRKPASSRTARLRFQNLLEVTSLASQAVDREACIIRGVKVLGFDSKNGRRYTPDAMQRAIPLYEGLHVNIDHPTDSNGNLKPLGYRDAEKRFGKLVNARFVPGDGIRADLKYLNTHRMANTICESAEKMPDAFMLSHNSDGIGPKVNGELVVEEITKVRSVDIVAEGGTTVSLFESAGAMKKTYKQIVESNKKLPAKQKRMIIRLLEDDGMGDEVAEDDDMTHKDYLMKAVGKLCEDDNNPDNHKTINQLMKILNPKPATEDFQDSKETERTAEDDGGDDSTAEDDDSESEDEPSKTAKEQDKIESLRRDLEQMKKKDQARTLCESDEFRISPSPVLLRTLMRCDNEKEMKEVLHEAKGSQKPRGTPPRSGGHITESGQGGNGVKVTDGKSFASAITGYN